MKKPRLMTPGPSPVPEDVLLELARPVIHHRSKEAVAVVAEVVDGFEVLFFRRAMTCLILASAPAPGAMEAAVVEHNAAGLKSDRARCRLVRIAVGCALPDLWRSTRSSSRRSGAKPVDPGSVVANALRRPSRRRRRVRHAERDLDRHRASRSRRSAGSWPRARRCIVVDGISGVGAMECRTDAWGIDVLCVGSQKALMMPPGPGVRRGEPEGLGSDRVL